MKHEENKLMRIGKELLESMNIDDNNQLKPRMISKKYLQAILEVKSTSFKNKPLHSYIHRKIAEDNKIDQKLSNNWTNNKYISSYFEAYACATSEQEVRTKDLIYRQQRLNNQTTTSDNKCTLCKTQVEDITHILSSCGKMPSRYYLPMRHDVVAKHVYGTIRKKEKSKPKIDYNGDEFIFVEKNIEYWWNISVKTPAKMRHNRLDLIIWNNKDKPCNVVEFSCPADMNVSKKVQEKEDNYGPLLRATQLTYPEYKFMFLPIIVGALGTIPKELLENIKKLGFKDIEASKLLRFIQQKSIVGSVKICKTFLNFKV